MRKRLMQNNARLYFSPSSACSSSSSSSWWSAWPSSSTRWRASRPRRTWTRSTVSITKKRQRKTILGQILWKKVMIAWDNSTHEYNSIILNALIQICLWKAVYSLWLWMPHPFHILSVSFLWLYHYIYIQLYINIIARIVVFGSDVFTFHSR